MTKGYKHLSANQRAAVLETYRRTLDVKATVAATGASVGQVRNVLHKNGIRPSMARGGACYRHIDSVRLWASEGVAVSEIARRIGTTSSKVSGFLKKHNIPRVRFRQAMENNPAWRGGRVIDVDGYVLCKSPGHPHADRHGYVREHRLVMEGVLGRHLLPSEVVHHRNKDRQDNRPENLQVFASNAEHLAEELTGHVPKWTEEGKRHLRECSRRMLEWRRNANRKASEQGGQG